MKTVGDAIRLRVDLIQRLEEASLSLDMAARRRLLTFVVVGGGYSGVETAGQISDLLRDVHRFYPRVHQDQTKLLGIDTAAPTSYRRSVRSWAAIAGSTSKNGGSRCASTRAWPPSPPNAPFWTRAR
jgi:hypothetical protein